MPNFPNPSEAIDEAVDESTSIALKKWYYLDIQKYMEKIEQ
jgi:hypothetical protein